MLLRGLPTDLSAGREALGGFPCGSEGKESACNAGDPGSIRKIPWRRKWQPTPVFLPREFHGQRNLVGYSPWGHNEWDMTEQLCFHFQGSSMYAVKCVRPDRSMKLNSTVIIVISVSPEVIKIIL